jgi:L-lactate dehydrogenase complex protein LldG
VFRPDWSHHPQQELYGKLTGDELVELFAEQCETMQTVIKRTTESALSETLEHMVETYGGGPIVASEDARFSEHGLSRFLEREDLSVWDPGEGRKNIERAERANVGVTFCDAALAESGTVVLFSRKGNGRTLNLLPKTYIAIVPKSAIVPRMTQAAMKIRGKIKNGEGVPSCVKFVSGPSNSADIEMKSVVGVHGPVRAAFLIVTDR